MQNPFRKAATVLTVVATIVATVMRILLTPQMQDTQTGAFKISYVIIGILLVSIALIFILVLAGNQELPVVNELGKKGRLPLAISGLLFGSILLISSLFDSWQWASTGITPPPNERVINSLDNVTLKITLLFGLLAGIFFIWMSIKLTDGSLMPNQMLALTALAPVVWIWVRLVRYEVSYASAIQVAQSFYDFVMLIFTMLFIFTFARYISGTGLRSPRMLLVYSLCTILLSMSGTITSIVMYMTGETQAYQSSRLAGFTDFGVGVFASCVAFVLVFAKRHPVAVEEEANEPTSPEDSVSSGVMKPDAE